MKSSNNAPMFKFMSSAIIVLSILFSNIAYAENILDEAWAAFLKQRACIAGLGNFE
jgi:hypothetical protein